ncbi:hypothetical protein L917_19706, partial [Phytophthora nicotianae]
VEPPRLLPVEQLDCQPSSSGAGHLNASKYTFGTQQKLRRGYQNGRCNASIQTTGEPINLSMGTLTSPPTQYNAPPICSILLREGNTD